MKSRAKVHLADNTDDDLSPPVYEDELRKRDGEEERMFDISDVYVDTREKALVDAISSRLAHQHHHQHHHHHHSHQPIEAGASFLSVNSHAQSRNKLTRIDSFSASYSSNLELRETDIMVDTSSDASSFDTNFTVFNEKEFQFKCDEIYEYIQSTIFRK